MQLRDVYAAGHADRGNFFAAGDALSFFDQQPVVVGISGNPPVVMPDQNQIAEPFEFVSGISDGAFVGRFDRCSFGGFDVNAVVGASLADGAVF